MLKRGKRSLHIMALIGVALSVGNCSEGPSIKIVDLDTGTTTRIKGTLSDVSGRERLIPAPQSSDCFYTLTKMQNGVLMRILHVDGRVLETRPMPLKQHGLSSRGTRFRNAGALSGDGRWLAYFDDTRDSFLKIDTTTGAEVSVVPDRDLWVEYLAWATEGENLLVIAQDGVNPRRFPDFLARVDFPSKKLETLYTDEDLYADEFRTSPDGKYLALLVDYRVKVIDLAAKASFFANSEDTIAQDFCWSPDGTQLAYVVVPPIEVVVLSIPERTVKTKIDVARIGGIPCGLAFLDNDHLICGRGDTDGAGRALRIFDLKTGQLTKQFRVSFEGSILVVDNGKKIICN
jgi:hypothetical protein